MFPERIFRNCSEYWQAAWQLTEVKMPPGTFRVGRGAVIASSLVKRLVFAVRLYIYAFLEDPT